MKKSVFALLTLLVVLIITCVYEKTYMLYSTSSRELTLIERTPSTQSNVAHTNVSTVNKEEKQVVAPVISVKEKETVTPPKTTAVVQKESSDPVEKTAPKSAPMEQEPKHVEKMPLPISKPAEEKTVSVEEKVATTLPEKVAEKPKMEAQNKTVESTPAAKTPVKTTEKMSTVSTNKEDTQPNKVSKKSDVQKKPAPEITGQKDIVDYIMWALNNRELALQNRDEVAARIEELIAQALSDRKVVLDEREKNEVALEKLQTELIDARDASYESIINPKNTKQGEK